MKENRVIFRVDPDKEEERLNLKKLKTSRSGGSNKRFGKSSVIEIGYRAADFQTRNQIVKTLEVPDSNSRTHIVRSTIDGWGFQVNSFNPEFFGEIPKEKYQQTVRKCNKVITMAYSSIKLDTKTPKNTMLNLLVIFGLLISLTGFILFETIVFNAIDNMLVIYIPTVLFLITMVLALAICVLSFFVKPRDKIREANIYQELQKILKDENDYYYKQMGYQWILPQKFFWLELHKLEGGGNNGE